MSNYRYLIIGGGFIGSEITAALVMNCKQVVMLFPEKSIGTSLYPHDLNQFPSDLFR